MKRDKNNVKSTSSKTNDSIEKGSINDVKKFSLKLITGKSLSSLSLSLSLSSS